MYRYAQIYVDTGFCHTVSEFDEEIAADHLIPLSETDDVMPGDIYDGETWTRPEPTPPPEPEPSPEQARIDALETENTDLKARLVDVELALAELFTTT